MLETQQVQDRQGPCPPGTFGHPVILNCFQGSNGNKVSGRGLSKFALGKGASHRGHSICKGPEASWAERPRLREAERLEEVCGRRVLSLYHLAEKLSLS